MSASGWGAVVRQGPLHKRGFAPEGRTIARVVELKFESLLRAKFHHQEWWSLGDYPRRAPGLYKRGFAGKMRCGAG